MDDRERLARYFAGACSGGREDRSPETNLARSIFRTELGRDVEPGGAALVSAAFAEGLSAAQIRRRVRSSVERMSVADELIGAVSTSFRDLAAVVETEHMQVAPDLIAECIATYRLVLGRDPDVPGFQTYVGLRAAHPLPDVVAALAASGEAASQRGNQPAPAAEIVALHARVAAMHILSAAVEDVVHAKTRQSRVQLDTIADRLDRLETLVTRLATMVDMRLGVASPA
jgi:hypothetical protein